MTSIDIDLEAVEQLAELFKDAKRDARINRFIEGEHVMEGAPILYEYIHSGDGVWRFTTAEFDRQMQIVKDGGDMDMNKGTKVPNESVDDWLVKWDKTWIESEARTPGLTIK